MNSLHNLLRNLADLLGNLPPVSSSRLVLPFVFSGSWTVMTTLGAPGPAAFVWAGVLAQVAHIWVVLPWVLARRSGGPAILALAALLGLLAVQLHWNAPWASQRLLSGFCVLYAIFMVMGIKGSRRVLDRFAPVTADAPCPLDLRQHLLKLYALLAILVVSVNEALLTNHAPLGARVATLSLLPVVLHYVFFVVLRLTCPQPDGDDR